ncbi:hypothetical protein TMatcc_007499 [Talaromyces marneffei ATCC 18224]
MRNADRRRDASALARLTCSASPRPSENGAGPGKGRIIADSAEVPNSSSSAGPSRSNIPTNGDISDLLLLPASLTSLWPRTSRPFF